jgi:hypothetical protein
MPISACRRLNAGSDDVAAKFSVHYYADAWEALMKALAD